MMELKDTDGNVLFKIDQAGKITKQDGIDTDIESTDVSVADLIQRLDRLTARFNALLKAIRDSETVLLLDEDLSDDL